MYPIEDVNITCQGQQEGGGGGGTIGCIYKNIFDFAKTYSILQKHIRLYTGDVFYLFISSGNFYLYLKHTVYTKNSMITRKSSCVNTRGIPPAA